MNKFGLMTLLGALSIGLAACGGGGEAGKYDAYVGTFFTLCNVSQTIKDAAGQPTNFRYVTTIGDFDSGRATLNVGTQHFAAANSTCEGGALVTHSMSGSVTFGNEIEVQLNGKTVSAVQMNLVSEAQVVSGNPVAGWIYPSGFFDERPASDGKDLAFVDGSSFYDGDSDTVGDDGYPTALNQTPVLTRQ